MKSIRTRSSVMIGLAAALVVMPAVAAAEVNEREILQRAAEKVIEKIAKELPATKAANDKIENVAVVPLRADMQDGYVTSILKSAVTRTPYSLFTRSDETWDKLVAEIEWGVRKEDIMDANTIQMFGRVKGVDAILFGQVWSQEMNMWSLRGSMKMSIHLGEVETGKILWSSGPVTEEAYIGWSDAISNFWRFPLLLLGAVVGLIVVLLILKLLFRAIRHAARPL